MQKTVRALKKSRGAFMTCLILGLLLVILAAAFSLYTNATKVEVFEAALEKADLGELMEIFLGSGEIPGLGGMFKGSTGSLTSSEMLSSFAQETIDYLVGKAETWEPSVSIMGMEMPLPISEDFMSHMEDVKGWINVGQKAFYALLAVAVVLLGRVITSSRKGHSGFSGAGYYIGVFLPLVLVGGIIGWAYFDFEGFWMFIHEHFIKDGIFSNGEVVMQIFTTDMFKAFIKPIVTTFAMLLGGIVLLPALIAPLCNLLKGGNK